MSTTRPPVLQAASEATVETSKAKASQAIPWLIGREVSQSVAELNEPQREGGAAV